MPQAPAAPPPAAPKPGPTAIPQSTGVINVPGTPAPAAAATPPKPGSAKERLFDEMKKKAGGGPGQPRSGEVPKPAEAPIPKTGESLTPEPKPGETPAAKAPDGQPAEAPKPGEAPAGEPPVAGKDGKKPSPWKLVEDYKGRLSKAEARIKELEGTQVNADERKSFEERLTKTEARNKELENYLTYVDYSQTEEFKVKYVQPYEKAWGKAMEDIKELTVDDGAGGQRVVVPNDMLAIVNAPLAKAREMAEELFGNFANDVMAHRKEIRGLFDAQAAALEDAKKNGADKLKKMQDDHTASTKALSETVGKLWQSENAAVLADEKVGPMFKPREGDEEYNTRLTKGFEFVDSAFAVNPADPKLTPEQRQDAVRKHVALRNRAAAYQALRFEVERLAKQLSDTQKELSQYKESEPGAAGGRTAVQPGTPVGGNAKANMFSELRKRAR